MTPDKAPRRWEIFCSQANHFINGPDTNGAMVVVSESDYDELKTLWLKATQHVLPGEYDTAESIQKYINDLQKELQRERHKVQILVACIETENRRCGRWPTGLDALAELEAIDNEGE